jgi:hypothetical protein
LNQLKGKYVEPHNLEILPRVTIETRSNVSPIPLEELQSLSVTELVDKLIEYQPETNSYMDNYTALSKSVHSLVMESPAQYADNAHIFLVDGLRSVYLCEYISALKEAADNGKEFSIKPVIEFCAEIVKRDKEPFQESLTSHERDLFSVHLEIARFLDSFLRRCDDKLSQSSQNQVEHILRKLLSHKDPSAEREENYGFDAGTYSLNCVRGVAMHALVMYALFHNRIRQIKTEADEKIYTPYFHPFARQAFENKLDKSNDESYAVHSIFGWHLPAFYFLDKNWVISNLELIFPPSPGKEPYWRAAWESYLLYSKHLYIELFQLFLPEYSKAVDQLCNSKENKQGHPVNGNKMLTHHLITAYMDNLIDWDTESGLLERFYDCASDDLRAHAVWTLSRYIESKHPEQESEVWQRIFDFWRRRLKEAQNSDNPEDFKNEISEFMRWLEFIPSDLGNIFSLIHESIIFLKDDFHTRLLLEYVAKQSTSFPLEANQLLEQVIDFSQMMWLVREEDIQTVLQAGLNSQNPSAREIAVTIINKSGERGDFRFESLLPS